MLTDGHRCELGAFDRLEPDRAAEGDRQKNDEDAREHDDAPVRGGGLHRPRWT